MNLDKKYWAFLAVIAVVVFIVIYALVHKSETPTWQGSDSTQGVGRNTPIPMKPSGN